MWPRREEYHVSDNLNEQLPGRTVVDPQGNKIGKIGQLWVDEETGAPTWASVHTGLFGMHESLVPIGNGRTRGDDFQVPVTKDQVKDAPRVEAENGQLSDRDMDDLYRYYNMDQSAGNSGRHAGDAPPLARNGTADRNGMADRNGQGDRRMQERAPQESMTRSEERLKVGTETVTTGRVRLRKVVVTEQQQVSVPVSHEEVRVVREPISESDRGRMAGNASIGEAEQEITLHAERPVVETEVVAKERVRLDTRTVAEQQQVGGTIRKEEIKIDDETTK
jgi:uncharacterized protein (TIGR02271 family)